MFRLFQGLLDTSTPQTPSYSHSETIMDTDTLKITSISIISMPHTAIITMVQPLVGGTIFTFLPTQIVTIILTLIVTRTQAHTATIISGLEVPVFALTKWRFTMK